MPHDMFKLALEVGRFLQEKGAGDLAMEAMAIIQAHDAEATSARRAGDAERQRKSRASRKSRDVTVTERDLPLSLSPDPSPYNPSNQIQTNACGSRLPENWEPSSEDIEAAKSDGLPEELIPTVLKDFRDHFIAEPGANGYSRDWSANWRKYCRVRVDIIANRKSHRMPTGTNERRMKPAATGTPAPSSFFASVGSPQWEAHLKASGKTSFPTTLHNGEEGWWFRTEWPAGVAAA